MNDERGRASALAAMTALVVSCAGACGPPAEREPSADAPLEVRRDPPADRGDALTIEVEVSPYRWSSADPNRLHHAGGVMLPVGRWVEMTFEAPGPPGGDARPQRLHLPEIGWTLAVPPEGRIVRWVRARRAFRTVSTCVESCDEQAEQFIVTFEARQPARFEAWMEALLRPPEGMSLARWGSRIADQNGCSACHGSLAGSLNEVWGRTRAMPDGTPTLVRGEAGRRYVRDYIRHPGEFGARGELMPAYRLPDAHVEAIVEFIRCGDVPTCAPERDEQSGEPLRSGRDNR